MATSPTPDSLHKITRYRFSKSGLEKQSDQLAVEEPLEIILQSPNTEAFTLTVTMRTPGQDKELATGFLFSEGLIKQSSDILDLSTNTESLSPDNTLIATLATPLTVSPDQLQRHFLTSSSCGVCGKTSLQALEMRHRPELLSNAPQITASVLQQLPEKLRQQQAQFSQTGGVHASALFSPTGELLLLREDVGRHNALDKLIGSLLLTQQLDQAKNSVLLMSGRISFELVQKALMADIPILAAIGAPSSLALQLAQRHGMTLIGFLKAEGFNAYCAPERVN